MKYSKNNFSFEDESINNVNADRVKRLEDILADNKNNDDPAFRNVVKGLLESCKNLEHDDDNVWSTADYEDQFGASLDNYVSTAKSLTDNFRQLANTNLAVVVSEIKDMDVPPALQASKKMVLDDAISISDEYDQVKSELAKCYKMYSNADLHNGILNQDKKDLAYFSSVDSACHTLYEDIKSLLSAYNDLKAKVKAEDDKVATDKQAARDAKYREDALNRERIKADVREQVRVEQEEKRQQEAEKLKAEMAEDEKNAKRAATEKTGFFKNLVMSPVEDEKGHQLTQKQVEDQEKNEKAKTLAYKYDKGKIFKLAGILVLITAVAAVGVKLFKKYISNPRKYKKSLEKLKKLQAELAKLQSEKSSVMASDDYKAKVEWNNKLESLAKEKIALEREINALEKSDKK